MRICCNLRKTLRNYEGLKYFDRILNLGQGYFQNFCNCFSPSSKPPVWFFFYFYGASLCLALNFEASKQKVFLLFRIHKPQWNNMFKNSFTGCWLFQVNLGGGVHVQQGRKCQTKTSQEMVQQEFSTIGADEKCASEQLQWQKGQNLQQPPTFSPWSYIKSLILSVYHMLLLNQSETTAVSLWH